MSVAARSSDQPNVWRGYRVSEYTIRSALPLADLAVVTEIDAAYDGDTLAPEPGPDWEPVDREPAEGWLESRTGLRYRVTRLARRTAQREV